jgi:hypothetical protein
MESVHRRGDSQRGAGRRDHGAVRAPLAHEDHGLRACFAAALRMQESVKRPAQGFSEHTACRSKSEWD